LERAAVRAHAELLEHDQHLSGRSFVLRVQVLGRLRPDDGRGRARARSGLPVLRLRATVSGPGLNRRSHEGLMAAIRIQSLSKHFGSSAVLKGLDLAIADGEFLVLVGPSGCGKSTLLRLVAGLEQPSSGEIYIGNRCVNDLDPKDR